MTVVQPPHCRPGRAVSLATAKQRLAVAFCLLAMAAAITLGVTIGWALRVGDFRNAPDPEAVFDGRTVMLELYLVAVDVVAGSITFGWAAHGGQTGCSVTAPDPASAACAPINIFFDQNLLLKADTADAPLSNGRPAVPIFAYDPQAVADPRGNYPIFRTSLVLYQSSSRVGSFQNYPFDVYHTRFSLYAQDALTNATVGVRTESDLTSGIAVGFNVVAAPNGDFVTSPGSIDQIVIVSRGVLVKAYAIVIVVSVWLITLIFMLSSARFIIFGYGQRVELLVTPVATLFAVTQLRQTMPQAPVGYGAVIDYIGLLPCLAAMSICGAANIGALAFHDPTRERATFVDRLCRYAGYRDAIPAHDSGGVRRTPSGSAVTPPRSRTPSTIRD